MPFTKLCAACSTTCSVWTSMRSKGAITFLSCSFWPEQLKWGIRNTKQTNFISHATNPPLQVYSEQPTNCCLMTFLFPLFGFVMCDIVDFLCTWHWVPARQAQPSPVLWLEARVMVKGLRSASLEEATLFMSHRNQLCQSRLPPKSLSKQSHLRT